MKKLLVDCVPGEKVNLLIKNNNFASDLVGDIKEYYTVSGTYLGKTADVFGGRTPDNGVNQYRHIVSLSQDEHDAVGEATPIWFYRQRYTSRTPDAIQALSPNHNYMSYLKYSETEKAYSMDQPIPKTDVKVQPAAENKSEATAKVEESKPIRRNNSELKTGDQVNLYTMPTGGWADGSSEEDHIRGGFYKILDHKATFIARMQNGYFLFGWKTPPPESYCLKGTSLSSSDLSYIKDNISTEYKYFLKLLSNSKCLYDPSVKPDLTVLKDKSENIKLSASSIAEEIDKEIINDLLNKYCEEKESVINKDIISEKAKLPTAILGEVVPGSIVGLFHNNIRFASDVSPDAYVVPAKVLKQGNENYKITLVECNINDIPKGYHIGTEYMSYDHLLPEEAKLTIKDENKVYIKYVMSAKVEMIKSANKEMTPLNNEKKMAFNTKELKACNAMPVGSKVGLSYNLGGFSTVYNSTTTTVPAKIIGKPEGTALCLIEIEYNDMPKDYMKHASTFTTLDAACQKLIGTDTGKYYVRYSAYSQVAPLIDQASDNKTEINTKPTVDIQAELNAKPTVYVKSLPIGSIVGIKHVADFYNHCTVNHGAIISAKILPHPTSNIRRILEIDEKDIPKNDRAGYISHDTFINGKDYKKYGYMPLPGKKYLLVEDFLEVKDLNPVPIKEEKKVEIHPIELDKVKVGLYYKAPFFSIDTANAQIVPAKKLGLVNSGLIMLELEQKDIPSDYKYAQTYAALSTDQKLLAGIDTGKKYVFYTANAPVQDLGQAPAEDLSKVLDNHVSKTAETINEVLIPANDPKLIGHDIGGIFDTKLGLFATKQCIYYKIIPLKCLGSTSSSHSLFEIEAGKIPAFHYETYFNFSQLSDAEKLLAGSDTGKIYNRYYSHLPVKDLGISVSKSKDPQTVSTKEEKNMAKLPVETKLDQVNKGNIVGLYYDGLGLGFTSTKTKDTKIVKAKSLGKDDTSNTIILEIDQKDLPGNYKYALSYSNLNKSQQILAGSDTGKAYLFYPSYVAVQDCGPYDFMAEVPKTLSPMKENNVAKVPVDIKLNQAKVGNIVGVYYDKGNFNSINNAAFTIVKAKCLGIAENNVVLLELGKQDIPSGYRYSLSYNDLTLHQKMMVGPDTGKSYIYYSQGADAKDYGPSISDVSVAEIKEDVLKLQQELNQYKKEEIAISEKIFLSSNSPQLIGHDIGVIYDTKIGVFTREYNSHSKIIPVKRLGPHGSYALFEIEENKIPSNYLWKPRTFDQLSSPEKILAGTNSNKRYLSFIDSMPVQDLGISSSTNKDFIKSETQIETKKENTNMSKTMFDGKLKVGDFIKIYVDKTSGTHVVQSSGLTKTVPAKVVHVNDKSGYVSLAISNNEYVRQANPLDKLWHKITINPEDNRKYKKFIDCGTHCHFEPGSSSDFPEEANQFWGMMKSDLNKAAYRAGATQLTKATKAGIIALLKRNKSENAEAMVQLLDSQMGEAVLALFLGYTLTYAPKLCDDPRAQKLAAEFRTGGMSTGMNVAFDTLMEVVAPVITDAFKNIMNDTPALEDSNEKLADVISINRTSAL